MGWQSSRDIMRKSLKIWLGSRQGRATVLHMSASFSLDFLTKWKTLNVLSFRGPNTSWVKLIQLLCQWITRGYDGKRSAVHPKHPLALVWLAVAVSGLPTTGFASVMWVNTEHPPPPSPAPQGLSSKWTVTQLGGITITLFNGHWRQLPQVELRRELEKGVTLNWYLTLEKPWA